MGTQAGIVIVGGGLAAARVARAFRDAGGEGPVSILSADTDPPYNRPPLSKGFLRGEIEADAVFVEPEDDLRRARHRPPPRVRGDGRDNADAQTVALADGDSLRLRPARARVRLAPASARHAGRDARGRAHLPHAARRDGGPHRSRVRLERARDRRRVHRHGDHRVAPPPRPRGHAGRPWRRALRIASGALRCRTRSSGSTATEASR